MIKIKFFFIALFIAIFFAGFTQEDRQHKIDSLSMLLVVNHNNLEIQSISSQLDSLLMPLPGNYKILEIQIYKKNQIKNYTKKNIKKWAKFYKRKKVPYIKEKSGKAIETYIIKIADSDNFTYFVVSERAKIISEEKIIIGNTYFMELNKIRDMGVIRGIDINNLSITIGTYILLPREAWRDDIYISPNLQGLYYVR